MQGLLNRSPIILRHQDSIPSLAGDLHWFMLDQGRINHTIQVGARRCCRYRPHSLNVRKNARIASAF